jgi:hypothetical protein
MHEKSARHWKRALECKLNLVEQRPYRRAERLKLLSTDPGSWGMPTDGFPEWENGLDHHLYWASRIDDTVGY